MIIDRHAIHVDLNKHNSSMLYLDIEELGDDASNWIVLSMSREQAKALAAVLVDSADSEVAP